VSEGFFTVYLGLNLPQEKMKEYLKIPHVFYSDDNPDADFYNSNDENFFEKTWVLLYSPSLMNAELASEGRVAGDRVNQIVWRECLIRMSLNICISRHSYWG